MQFRPCIDIHRGKVKQIIGSSLSNSKNSLATNFVSEKNASYYATLYKQNNLTGGHVIMLDQSEATRQEAINALQAFPNGLQIGGGINHNNAMKFLDAGASHVIVSSFIFEDRKVSEEKLTLLKEVATKKRIVLDLSCRKKDNKYFVVIDRWQTFTNLEISLENLKKLSKHCDEFLIHGVDVEGKQQGIEKELIKLLSTFQEIPITYAGGIRNQKDIETIKSIGKGNIHFTVGSALDIFGGKLKYKTLTKN